ncbi:hypothetical protein DFH09DRAFT_1211083 [Mycena vulgaris]|nr:hypothetical protein DFH09DRAFT_1217153 [Mycena vulgaris]KAJ6485211.1 hypothetical protein DFH09DRAFT_1211083 [Mycena vulgaris]
MSKNRLLANIGVSLIGLLEAFGVRFGEEARDAVFLWLYLECMHTGKSKATHGRFKPFLGQRDKGTAFGIEVREGRVQAAHSGRAEEAEFSAASNSVIVGPRGPNLLVLIARSISLYT